MDPEIKFAYEELTDATSLAYILRLAVRLISLTIECFDHFVTDESLRQALLSHSGLQRISFAPIGAQAFNIISGMASRLRYVELRKFDEDGLPHDPKGLMIAHFSQSLETLKLWAAASWLDDLNAQTIWPRVHSLYLNANRPLMSQLARMFPNLRTLEYPSGQGFLLDSDHGGEAQWRSLDFVRTMVVLPISCPVRRLHICYYEYLLRTPESMTMLAEMIQRTSPIVLTFPMRFASIVSISQVAPDVRYLHIFEEWDKFTDVVDIESTSISLAESVRTLPLVGLTFSFAGFRHSDPRRDNARILKLAQDVAALVPSLEYVGFARVFIWFRIISRSDSIVQLERLSPLEGSRVEEHLLSLS